MLNRRQENGGNGEQCFERGVRRLTTVREQTDTGEERAMALTADRRPPAYVEYFIARVNLYDRNALKANDQRTVFEEKHQS